jgi:outer membrane protein, protease secretion system
MRAVLCRCVGAAILACFTASSWALDLLTSYRQALTNDATFLASRSNLEAIRENIPQARAGLLPQVSASGQFTRNFLDQRQTVPGPAGGTLRREIYYGAESANVALRQPLYRKANWAQLSFAEAQVAAAEANFEKDRQDAGLRVGSAYFDVLLAQARVRNVQAQLEAFEGQLRLAERAFQAGEGTRTDIDDARSRALQARAALTEADFALTSARRALGALIGRTGEALADVVPERLPLRPPQPATLEAWLEEAESANPELASLRHQVEMARQEIERQRAGHHPTIDIIAGRTYGSNQSSSEINQRNTTDYLGFQVAVPIYSGGGVSAAVRQAAANLNRAQFVLDAARERIAVETQRNFYGVTQGIDKVRAFEAAREAANQAVVSTRIGVGAGTRTIVDVLNAVQRAAESEQNLAQARYEFLVNRLRLAATAGQLDDTMFAEVNAALAMR